MTHEAIDKKTDLLGRIDTQALYQPFLEKLNELLNACAARGQLYVATSGFRSYEDQNALFAKRYKDPKTGKWRGPTKARGGQSSHNFGIAVDLVPHDGTTYNGKLVLEEKDEGYAAEYYVILSEEIPKVGLDWGGRFDDNPHVQWLLPQGIRLSELDVAYRTGGFPSAWALLTKT